MNKTKAFFGSLKEDSYKISIDDEETNKAKFLHLERVLGR